jgi:hypothetical protein
MASVIMCIIIFILVCVVGQDQVVVQYVIEHAVV